MLRGGGTFTAAAEAAGVSRPALDKRARSDETLAAAMAAEIRRLRALVEDLTAE